VCRSTAASASRNAAGKRESSQISHDSPLPDCSGYPASDRSNGDAYGFLHDFFSEGILAYLEGVGITPSQSVEDICSRQASQPLARRRLIRLCLRSLWRTCDAAAYGLERERVRGDSATGRDGAVTTDWLREHGRFEAATGRVFQRPAARRCWCWRAPAREGTSARGQHFRGDLSTTRWNARQLRSPAAKHSGRELADSLYAELYGLKTCAKERDAVRWILIKGRGSLDWVADGRRLRSAMWTITGAVVGKSRWKNLTRRQQSPSQ
jgi:hypothetical protein